MTKFKVLWRTWAHDGEFFILFLNWNATPANLVPWLFAVFVQVERVEIIAIYHKWNKVIFSSDVFVAVANKQHHGTVLFNSFILNCHTWDARHSNWSNLFNFQQTGLSAVQNFTDVLVPRYSQEELESCLQFYRKRGVLSKGNVVFSSELATGCSHDAGAFLKPFPGPSFTSVFAYSWKVVTGMDTRKQGWTPDYVYTTEKMYCKIVHASNQSHLLHISRTRIHIHYTNQG